MTGNADILFQHTDGRAAIYLMNGVTPAVTAQILNAGAWRVAQVADFDGDGRADIAWQNADGRIAVWVMNGTTMTSSKEVMPAGSGWGVTGLGQ